MTDPSGRHGLRRRTLLLGLAAVPVAACSNSSGDQAGTPTASAASSVPTITATATPSASTASTPASPVPTVGASAPATGTVKVSDTLITDLETPWGLTFLPDGSALLGSRDSAEIRRLTRSGDRVRSTLVGTMPDVVHDGEGGLLSIVASPGFSSDRHLFVYHSTASDNRVTRITFQDGALRGATEVLTGLPRNTHHNGGGLVFGPDGYLYVGTGDGQDTTLPQDRDSLGGKILRITRTGTAAPGNPFDSTVFSYGHRNVESLAFDGKQLWAVEFGDKTADELNRVVAGANYGWPETQGRTSVAGYTSPAAQWPTDDAGPAGIAIRDGVAWIACLTGTCLYRVRLHADGADEPQRFLADTYGRLRRVAFAPDGALWLVTNNTDGRATPRTGDDRILALTVT